MSVNVCVCVCVCVYDVYVHVHTHTHTLTHRVFLRKSTIVPQEHAMECVCLCVLCKIHLYDVYNNRLWCKKCARASFYTRT